MQESRIPLSLKAYELLVILPTIAWLAYTIATGEELLSLDMLLWVAVVAVVELLPVPSWRGLSVSVAFPLLVAIAILHSPAAAGVIALMGSFDPRELKREVRPLRAVFNRSQSALSVIAGSAVFHALASVDSPPAALVPAAMACAVTDYVINISLVAAATSIRLSVSPWTVLRQMHIGGLWEFVANYLALGFLGTVLARFYVDVGFWSVAIFLIPLIFARQMFFRSRALEEAHRELKDREAVMRALSNRMAEERQDERSRIAAYLHDDLAQLLFKLSLQVDIAARHLDEGDVNAVRQTLDEVKQTKSKTSDRIRALVRDLHRSPLGRAGLGEAIQSFVNEVGDGAEATFDIDVADLSLPPAIQLLTYQIAREAIMNSLKYAEADKIAVSFGEREEGIELSVIDDGVGFDAEAGEPEGHYGLTMMRERALVAGATFDLASSRGKGTGVTVRFPRSWLQAAAQPPEEPKEEVHVQTESQTEPGRVIPAGGPAVSAEDPPLLA